MQMKWMRNEWMNARMNEKWKTKAAPDLPANAKSSGRHLTQRPKKLIKFNFIIMQILYLT